MKVISEQTTISHEQQMKFEAFDLFHKIVSDVAKIPDLKMAIAFCVGDIISEFSAKEDQSSESGKETKIKDLELWGNIGKLITLGTQYIADKDKNNPSYLADLLKKPVSELMMNIDFGNVYEMVAASEDRKIATQKMIQEVVGEFPTKAGILNAVKMKKIVTSMKKKRHTLSAFETLTPEMLIKSLLHMADKIFEAKDIAAFVNSVAELVRKVHTGSSILSESGRSMIEVMVNRKLNDILQEVDPEVLRKAAIGLFETFEALSSAIMMALTNNSSFLGELLPALSSIQNSRIRRTGKKIDLMEQFLDTEENANSALKEFAEVDTQEIGEILNSLFRIINRINDLYPGMAVMSISSVLSVIDRDELNITAQWLIPEMVEFIRPAADVVMPALINGLSDLIVSQHSNEMDEALYKFKTILLSNGGEEI